MQQYGRSQFADRFAEVAADSDYSRFPVLRDLTQHDIRAAALAMWAEMTKRGWDREEAGKILDSNSVERVLLNKIARWDDDSHLVSTEFQEYWDATDEMKFSSGLLEDIRLELMNKYIVRKRNDGLTVIENQHGIWLFNMKEALR